MEKEEAEDTEGQPGRCSVSLKTTYVLGPSEAGCYTVPIPDIPEAAWLAAGSEWLILEQHVLHSSNHLSQPQARQSTTSTTRQSFVPVSLHPEKVLQNFIHTGKGTLVFSTHFCKAHPPFTGSASQQVMMLCNLSLHPILPSGIRTGGSRRSRKNTLGRSMPVWENTSPDSPPLSANNPHTL